MNLLPEGRLRGPDWTRRDLARLLLLGAALPSKVLGGEARRRVGIVGGGMTGVALAWLLDGERDVVLLEARDHLGGNVQSATVQLDGHEFVVDLGAQYFHPGPYPLYSSLLQRLGLFDPASPDAGATHAFAASITLDAAGGEPTPRFVSPYLPGRGWPLLASWNGSGVQAFAKAFLAAKRREWERADWSVTLDEWLPTLGLEAAQWEGMILPWAASLFSGSIEEARGLSARAAMIFAAKALPANPLAPIQYDVLRLGMIEPLERMAEQCATARFVTGAPVACVRRAGEQFLILLAEGGGVVVDDLVFAASGPPTLRLLEDLDGTGAQQAALRGIEFRDARIAVHAAPTYVPDRPAFRSFLNCRVDGDACEASMALGDVLAGAPPAIAARVYKSWVTHRADPPGEVLREAAFRHMLPTAPTLEAQSRLRALQGRDGIWFAGGYLHPYDAQETALRSALRVALGLRLASPRLTSLRAADPEAAEI
jgi:predicted NAD/FAD-binding protein